MIVIVDNTAKKVYVNVSKSEAARIVGVSRKTVYEWTNKRVLDKTFLEQYNGFDVYFRPVVLKQRKGYSYGA